MRVVIDTNVLVSAALRNRDPEAVIDYIAKTSGVEWVATAAITREYRAVLRRPKYNIPDVLLEQWDGLIQALVLVVEDPPDMQWPADPDDAIFVSCAVGARADFLITGDEHLLRAGKLGDALVLTVSQFKRFFVDTPSDPSPPQ